MALLKQQTLSPSAPVLWLTGLSGAGKTTIALALEAELKSRGIACRVLDGDDLRGGLNGDLGFSADDRRENIRRVAEVARLFADIGVVTIAAFITPTNALRAMARTIIGAGRFVEVFVSTPIDVCMARDAKGLYAKAQRGEISDFTGVSAPFEEPTQPDISIDTSSTSVAEAVSNLLLLLQQRSEKTT